MEQTTPGQLAPSFNTAPFDCTQNSLLCVLRLLQSPIIYRRPSVSRSFISPARPTSRRRPHRPLCVSLVSYVGRRSTRFLSRTQSS